MPALRTAISHLALAAVLLLPDVAVGQDQGAQDHAGVPQPPAGAPAVRFVPVQADLFNYPGSLSNAWGDFDADGDLDLAVSTKAGEVRLYRNDGGTFTSIGATAGLPLKAHELRGLGWDQNGTLDVFLANQSGEADALWRNDGGSFTDVAVAAGVAGPARTKAEGGVGCAVGDYDNDGLLDLFVPNYGPSGLYRNLGDGTFEDVSAKAGVNFVSHAVGAAWGDYDNDGWLDLSVMAYEGPRDQQVPTDALLHNEPDGTGGRRFVNVLARDSAVNAGDHGVQWVDYDGDGLLDLSLTDGYGPTGGHPVFRNTLPAETGRRSLSVLVLDAQGHFTRVGAEVRLRDAAGQVIATRIVSSGDGYNTQSALPLHFGLAQFAPVSVEVTFITSHGRDVTTLHDIDPADYAGKQLIVREGQPAAPS